MLEKIFVTLTHCERQLRIWAIARHIAGKISFKSVLRTLFEVV
jgi:hypothetical protein